jgi:protein-S-isoprenylcysteine O-methyltransferase Ste14
MSGMVSAWAAPSTRGYDVFTRLFGSLWFLFLAAFVAKGAIADFAISTWPQLFSRSLLTCFYLILWFLIITRRPAESQLGGLMPRVAAFVGTYMPWCVTFVAGSSQPVPNILATLCLLLGLTLMLITILHLGRSFSLVPQARAVVQSGPYRCIRHPLYLAEEIAVLGVVLQFLSPITVTVLVVHIAVQVCRIRYEEKLLGRTYPEYHHYAKGRWRLIPLLW